MKLYSDLSSAVTASYEHRPTPPLLSTRTIRALISQNPTFFWNTIYKTQLQYVYKYGTVWPVHPEKPNAVGFILHLPRILRPSLSPFYCLQNVRLWINSTFIRYKLPMHVVVQNSSFHAVDLEGCNKLDETSFFCNTELHLKTIPSLKDISN